MSVKWVWNFLLLVLTYGAAFAESNDSPQVLKQSELTVGSKLEQFKKTKDPELLLAARKAASSMNPKGGKDTLSAVDEACLRLQVKVLLALSAARDPNYDRNAQSNIVYVNVTPPLMKKDQPVISGMDPKAIKDPEVRKAYEEAIAANNRRNEKLKREMALSREVEYALIDIWVFVMRGFPENSGAKKSAVELLEKTVTDKALLARLKSDSMPGVTW